MKIIRLEVAGQSTLNVDIRQHGYKCGVKKIALVGNGDSFAMGNSDASNYMPVTNLTKAGFTHLEFPIIDGKSPCVFKFRNYGTGGLYLNIVVEELGGIADPDYFNPPAQATTQSLD